MDTRTLSAQLPSGTLYVSGTVNGTAYTWTNTESNTWEATVARAQDDVYHVALTIINGAGTASEQSFTLYYGLHLITDRTQADVHRVKTLSDKEWNGMTADEQAEWLDGLKGAYNASDLNRVGSAVEYLHDRLAALGYAADVAVKKDWQMEDIPNNIQMAQYLQNVENLVSAYCVKPDTPALPESMDHLDWQGANAIEKNLEDIDDNITNMQKAWMYSGEVYAGEGYFS